MNGLDKLKARVAITTIRLQQWNDVAVIVGVGDYSRMITARQEAQDARLELERALARLKKHKARR